MAASRSAWCIGEVNRRSWLLASACLAVLACGSRTSLLSSHAAGSGDGGGDTTSSSVGGSTGSSVEGDPCQLPLGASVIATMPSGPLPDQPERAWVRGSAVLGDTLYFANFWSLYSVPICGGEPQLVYTNPDGGLDPDSDYPRGVIETMAVGSAGIYWWEQYGVSGEHDDELHHTSLDGSSSVVVPTAFEFPAIVSGPSGVYLLDSAVRRINPDDTIDYLGSAAALEFLSLPAFDGANVYFSGALENAFGPLFRIPLSGGELVEYEPRPWLREIISDGDWLYAIRGGDPTAIVRFSTDGAQEILADGQPWDAQDLALVGPHLVFRACEALWRLDRDTGEVSHLRGEPDCYTLDPDDDPVWEHAPKARRLATDAHAAYVFEDDRIVRLRLE